MGRAITGAPLLTNTVIAELLSRAADEPQRTDQQRRALRRAGRAAFRWPVEAAAMAGEGRSLTELRFVGPWLARLIAAWVEHPPPLPEPPAIRCGFLARVDVDRILRTSAAAGSILGDLQTHTTGSDGTASVADMASGARARGLEYLAITDHSKGLAIAGGMDEHRLARQGEEIERLNAELSPTGFRLLRAVEMNLSPAGAGDLAPDFVWGLDLVLGAFHSRLRVTDDQTGRYLAALRNRSIDVLAHPRGRVYDFRVGLRADWGRVFECAEREDRAVEIDAYPDRQDLDVDLLRLARDTGVLISIGSDAHAPDQLAHLDYGVAAAREAGIPEERILNCRPVGALLAWTSEHRARAAPRSRAAARAPA
jgi:histidinol phosphatase-like PHP family hydrolase